MAYGRMGTCYSVLNDNVRAAENLTKAYEFRKDVSEWERLYIASHYEHFVTGNMEAARKAYELSLQTYPRDTPLGNLGAVYSEMGNYDQALAAYERAMQLDQKGDTYGNLINGYLQLNRLEDARATARQAQSRNVDSPEIHLHLYWVDFLQHDTAAMERDATSEMSTAGYEDQVLNSESDTALYEGELARARLLTRRAAEAALREDEREAAATYKAEGALHEVLVGNSGLVEENVRAALAISQGRDVQGFSALALALAGDSEQAARLSNELAKRFPQDTIVHFKYLPTIQATAWLRRSDTAKALQSLNSAVPYELGGNFENLNFVLYPVYLRGEAYLAAKQGPAAAAEFQKILDHPGVVRNEPIGALSHLQLGRAYALSGDTAKAKAAYNDFLSLWKNADPDIPILKEAKAEYVKLQ
jgi:tetratricopeptide (TPR) repeat protein